MTRDEAKELIRMSWPGCPGPMASENLADVLNALGVLKFDEPKSIKGRACDAFHETPELDDVAPIVIFDALSRAGLEIVEKKS